MKLSVRLARWLAVAAVAGATLLSAGPVMAAAFELAVSPSRFVVEGKSGERIGQSIELHNLGAQATEVAVRTIDWSFSEAGELTFHDALQPGSCRPWVLLERPRLTVPARGTRSFRFQIEVPKDAPRGECRFMVAIEGVEPAQSAVIQSGGASLDLPVTGRIAVAVYARINGAEPRLELKQIGVRAINGKPMPFVTVHNAGDAHGRLDGGLDATDASGKPLTLLVDGSPVLAGQTRTLPFTARGDDDRAAPALKFPLKAKGTLDWEKGGFKVDTELK